MKCDVVLAGVGGQGVLSMGSLIAMSALDEGLYVKQSEVHGMAQRGGAVQAFLRLSDSPIASDLVTRGTADIILSMEPLEGLRYLDMLAPDGVLVTAGDPVENIPDYPDVAELLTKIRRLPRVVLVQADRLAREAGSPKTRNVVMVGAALHLLPIRAATVERQLERFFAPRGRKVADMNLRALAAGRREEPCLAS